MLDALCRLVALAVHEGGELLATGGEDGVIWLLNYDEGAHLQPPARSPEARILAAVTCCNDALIRLLRHDERAGICSLLIAISVDTSIAVHAANEMQHAQNGTVRRMQWLPACE